MKIIYKYKALGDQGIIRAHVFLPNACIWVYETQCKIIISVFQHDRCGCVRNSLKHLIGQHTTIFADNINNSESTAIEGMTLREVLDCIVKAFPSFLFFDL